LKFLASGTIAEERYFRNMNKLLCCVCIIALSAQAVLAQQKGKFTDPRDGKTYKTVKIGVQTWMAENLNYPETGSMCYDDKSANCREYGRLYSWWAAMRACPKGWHLPTDTEWEILADFAGGSDTASRKLRAKSGWSDDGNGTDDYGFSALPGGGSGSGLYDDAGYFGFWWSATEYDANDAWARRMVYGSEYVNRNHIVKSYSFSVRCVQD
ncbi:MAG: fibrobacter succinogenes major paralogous domain-containing protein, partial [Fibromonadales bacterium]|nr:fibrobacter succinogenes major paralogous domain-containing protein [Fibromonadales bacterium]